MSFHGSLITLGSTCAAAWMTACALAQAKSNAPIVVRSAEKSSIEPERPSARSFRNWFFGSSLFRLSRKQVVALKGGGGLRSQAPAHVHARITATDKCMRGACVVC